MLMQGLRARRRTHGLIRQCGFSLLEMIIALGLFVVAVTMVLQALASGQQYDSLGAAQDEVALAADRVLGEIARDLAASAWHFADTGVTYDPSTGWDHQSLYQPSGTPLDSFQTDRTRRYYPLVVQQSAGGATTAVGLASQYPHSARALARVSLGTLPDLLPGKASDFYEQPNSDGALTTAEIVNDVRSFHARSRELIFLRTTVAGWHLDPMRQQSPVLRFSGTSAQWKTLAGAAGSGADTPAARAELGVLFASGWKPNGGTYVQRTPGTPYGEPLPAGNLDISQISAGTIIIRPLWETRRAPVQTQDADALREYQYAVVPAAAGRGLGRLVRACLVDFSVTGAPADRGDGIELGQAISRHPSNSRLAMVVQKVLSDDCTRIVFTTARHDSALLTNQVRVRVYLARRVGTGQEVIRRMIETVLNLGTRPTDLDMRADRATMGSAIPFLY